MVHAMEPAGCLLVMNERGPWVCFQNWVMQPHGNGADAVDDRYTYKRLRKREQNSNK